MGKKKLLFLMLAVVLALSLAACGDGSASTFNSAGTTENLDYTSDDVTGGKALEQINLFDLALSQEGGDAVMKLTFVQGSEVGGVTQSAVDDVPAYTISQMPEPNRLLITMEGISWQDYRIPQNLLDYAPILGMFQRVTNVASEKTTLELYINLANAVEYNVSSEANVLTIRLHEKADAEPSQGYYVTLNAFNEYADGRLGEDLGLTPTLCADLNNVTLVSQKFADEAAANEFLASLTEKLSSILPERTPQLMELEAGVLPTYQDDVDVGGLEQRVVAVKDGKELKFPILAVDGKAIAKVPMENAYLVAKPVISENQTDATEELWLYYGDGKSEKFVEDYEFNKVLEAKFSADGKKLAIVEIVDAMNITYIYDKDTKELINVSEEGFGTNTSGMDWSDEGYTLYAITGDEVQQVMKYSLDGETKEFNAVEEQSAEMGALECVRGTLYFSDMMMEKIYSMDPATGERKDYTTGLEFSVSPTNDYMSILRNVDSDDGKNLVNELVIRPVDSTSKVPETGDHGPADTAAPGDDLPTDSAPPVVSSGDELVISHGDLIMSYVWSEDGTKLYYTVDKGSEEGTGQYYYSLYCYTVGEEAPELVMEVSSFEILSAVEENKLLMVSMYNRGGIYVPVTYILDLAAE
ncbi:hypothetical protein [Gehongia tenuis]|uniref:PD40 domain-containing protein n=1 Tax=Gehongia tenuis TaxID=2763655 RepID=A0A926D4J5_9FIRM|nr:hypothetical protein [Gehongia tenuis]MBC8531222.1 PD40 domain-containing protein [Gehongia tenuis]